MFHDDNKYFITDRSEWIEPEKIFLLSHYLDALKYMPQEEIRQLSPDADGYSVFMRHEGAPGDYDRVLKYSQNGVNANDGWYIHLEVQPLHEVEGGGYNGTGDEVIHLFYNSGDNRDDIAGKPISMMEKALGAVLQSPSTKTAPSLITKECLAAISEQEALCLMEIPLS